MRGARSAVLSTERRDTLESRARTRSAPARNVERARIVLLAASGMQDKRIAAIKPGKAPYPGLLQRGEHHAVHVLDWPAGVAQGVVNPGESVRLECGVKTGFGQPERLFIVQRRPEFGRLLVAT